MKVMDTKTLIGKPLDVAIRMIEENGLEARVILLDGVDQHPEDDLREDRVDLTVIDHVVINAEIQDGYLEW